MKLTISLILVINCATAQHSQHSLGGLSPIVDGEQNPNQISDKTAIKVLMMSLMETDSNDPNVKARLASKIARIGLSPSDSAIVTDRSHRLHNNWMPLQARWETINKSLLTLVDSRLADERFSIHLQQEAIAESVYNDLSNSLSVQGSQQLRIYLAAIKRKIKIYPNPKM